jgi:hypothetical protein
MELIVSRTRRNSWRRSDRFSWVIVCLSAGAGKIAFCTALLAFGLRVEYRYSYSVAGALVIGRSCNVQSHGKRARQLSSLDRHPMDL